jgi:hypothetical protein
MLVGYGMSQAHGFMMNSLFESPRSYTPALEVRIVRPGPGGPQDVREGTLYCEPPKTALDWARQIGGIASRFAFSFVPFF